MTSGLERTGLAARQLGQHFRSCEPESNKPDFWRLKHSSVECKMWARHTIPRSGVAHLNVNGTLETPDCNPGLCLMQTSTQPSPRHYKHSLRLLCRAEGREQTSLKKGQKKSTEECRVTSKTAGPASMSDCPCCFVPASFSGNLVADVADESFAAVHIFSTLLSWTVLKQARQTCGAERTGQISCQMHLLTTVFGFNPQTTN